VIASIALGIIAWSGGNAWDIAVLGLLSAAILAFLGFNLRLGGRALVLRSMAPVTALWLFAVPLIDTVSIMGCRVLLGRSPFLANQEHFHPILLAAGFSPKRALVLILLIGLAAACVGLVGHFLGVSKHWMFLGFLFLFALHFWILMRAWRTRPFLGRPLAPTDDT